MPDTTVDRGVPDGSTIDPYIRERARGGALREGGATNTIIETRHGTVIKLFTRHPITAFFFTIAELVFGRFTYISRAERMVREAMMADRLHDTPLTVPRIVRHGRISIEFEKVPGTPARTWLATVDDAMAEQFGERLGHLLTRLEQDGIILRDCRLSNFLVDGDTLYSLDHEYTAVDPASGTRLYTLITILSSARHLNPHRYQAFRTGLTRGYPHQSIPAEMMAGLVSIYRALARETDPVLFRNAVYNSLSDMKNAFVATVNWLLGRNR